EFCEGSVLVAHNAEFDTGFIRINCEKLGLPYDYTVLDTVSLARLLLPELSKYKLNIVAKALNITLENHHRAVDDAKATAEIFLKFLNRMSEKGIETLDQLNEMAKMSPEAIKKAPTYHGIILVKNEIGRINLNRLVSVSNLEYFNRRPRMPKSVIEQYREGL